MTQGDHVHDSAPAWPALCRLIEEVVSDRAGRHPGIIAEAIVERVAATYRLAPREVHHRERRKDHLERTRRLTHEVYRALADAGWGDPGREIAARIRAAFLLSPKEDGEAGA